jgi:uncharacterized LabA/DUF88 family protein
LPDSDSYLAVVPAVKYNKASPGDPPNVLHGQRPVLGCSGQPRTRGVAEGSGARSSLAIRSKRYAKYHGHISMKKVAIFVDVQNIYYTAKQTFGRNFDYNKFWSKATTDREVVKAVAYAIERGDQKQREFQNILRAIGFEVKLKPFIQRSDGSAKGDWDVGITIDAMEYADSADVVILVSGDGDFDLLVNKLRVDRGKRVEVYGVSKLTAASLMNAASEFMPIDTDLLLN